MSSRLRCSRHYHTPRNEPREGGRGVRRNTHASKNKIPTDIWSEHISYPLVAFNRRRYTGNDKASKTHIIVTEFAQDLDLSQNPLRVHEIFESPRDFLDGNFLTGLCVESGYYHPVRPDAYGLNQLVLFIDLPTIQAKNIRRKTDGEQSSSRHIEHK